MGGLSKLLTFEVRRPFPSRLVPVFSLMKATKSSRSRPLPYSSPALLLFGKNFSVGNPLTSYLKRHYQALTYDNTSFIWPTSSNLNSLFSKIPVFISINICNYYIFFQFKCWGNLLISLKRKEIKPKFQIIVLAEVKWYRITRNINSIHIQEQGFCNVHTYKIAKIYKVQHWELPNQ